MKVEIKRTTFADGELVEAGKIYELPADTANDLIRLNKAVIAKEKPKAKSK